jgi:hypothetical protein
MPDLFDAFDREPDFTYTSSQLEADGALVDLATLYCRLDYGGQPVNRASAALVAAAVPAAIVRRPDAEDKRRIVSGYLLDLVDQLTDTAEEGEPKGVLWATPPQELLGDRPVWMQRNDVGGFTLLFPEDY